MPKRSRLKREVMVNLQSLVMDMPEGMSYNQMMSYAKKNLPKKKVQVESVEEF